MSETVYADRPPTETETAGLTDAAVTEVRGHAQVLAHGPLLRELAARCGQRGAVDHLAYQLSVPYFGAKLPCLFLLYDTPRTAGRALPTGAANLPVAAVLLHQYRVLGVATGLYIPADLAGDWTVLAPAPLRAEVAALLGAHLLRSGARLAIISVTLPAVEALPVAEALPETLSPGRPGPSAIARRPLLRTLRLRATLDETLALMGSHTRRNLRLARRQAVNQVAARFEPHVALSEDEFLAINREGFYPVPDRVARWRYRTAHQTEGGFLAAVSTRQGETLGVLGGRRYVTEAGPCTAIDWQLNRTSFSRLSPGSLMRIFLIEHEIERGTAELRFEGGTPHSMRSAFQPEVVTDLLYARPSLSPALFRRLGRLLPKGNLLGDLLLSPGLHWQR